MGEVLRNFEDRFFKKKDTMAVDGEKLPEGPRGQMYELDEKNNATLREAVATAKDVLQRLADEEQEIMADPRFAIEEQSAAGVTPDVLEAYLETIQKNFFFYDEPFTLAVAKEVLKRFPEAPTR